MHNLGSAGRLLDKNRREEGLGFSSSSVFSIMREKKTNQASKLEVAEGRKLGKHRL